MPILDKLNNLLLPAVGNYKIKFNNFGHIDDIDKVTTLLYKNLQILNTDIDALNNRIIQYRYYEVVAGTSSGNYINVPQGGTVALNKFGGSKDAVLSRVDESNVPTWESPKTLGGTIITTSLDSSGNYVFSGTPVDDTLALIYVFNIYQKASLTNVAPTSIIEETEILGTLADVLNEGNYTNNGQTIKALNGPGLLNLRNGVDGYVEIKGTDNSTLTFNNEGVKMSKGTLGVSHTTSLELSDTEAKLFIADPSFTRSSSLGVFVNDTARDFNTGALDGFPGRLGAKGGILQAGVSNSAQIGGELQNVKTSGAAYVNKIIYNKGENWETAISYTPATQENAIVWQNASGVPAFLTDIPDNIYTGNGSIPSGRVATIVDKLTFAGGSIKIDNLGGVSDRLVESDANGDLTAQRSIHQAYITDIPTIVLLETLSNWNASGVYIGTALSGTVQGQKHYDTDFLFEAVLDNSFIRLTRG